MTCAFTASEIILIITACGASLTGFLIAMRQSMKRSTCCLGSIDYKEETVQPAAVVTAEVIVSPSPAGQRELWNGQMQC